MDLAPEEIARAQGALEQAEGQADYAKSLLDATVIRAPVSGTILERAAEKGELMTSGFASTAEGGPQGLVVSLADLNDLQAELDIAQDDFSKLGAQAKGHRHDGCLSRPPVRRCDLRNLAGGRSSQGYCPGESANSASGFLSAARHEHHRKVSGERKPDRQFAAARRSGTSRCDS